MKKYAALLSMSVVALVLFGCAGIPRGLGPLTLVDTLDAQRFLGRWYEIARFPHSFEKSIVGATAEYSARGDGRIQVVNSGFRDTLDGAYTEARAVAWVPDARRPAALKVMFFWPFAADYLVFGLDQEDYSWAVVGSDSRAYLWFLSRAPKIDDELFHHMKELAAAQGYDLSRLSTVPQKQR